jgi:hypothetical protein
MCVPPRRRMLRESRAWDGAARRVSGDFGSGAGWAKKFRRPSAPYRRPCTLLLALPLPSGDLRPPTQPYRYLSPRFKSLFFLLFFCPPPATTWDGTARRVSGREGAGGRGCSQRRGEYEGALVSRMRGGGEGALNGLGEAIVFVVGRGAKHGAMLPLSVRRSFALLSRPPSHRVTLNAAAASSTVLEALCL